MTINAFYGQTGCNVVVSSCASLFAPQIGAIGHAVPGHRVSVVDNAGNGVPARTAGNIAIAAPDPVMFLGCRRNDQATRDESGFIRFVGHDDDVITSAGCRIAPASIKDCLLHHPAVCMSAHQLAGAQAHVLNHAAAMKVFHVAHERSSFAAMCAGLQYPRGGQDARA